MNHSLMYDSGNFSLDMLDGYNALRPNFTSMDASNTTFTDISDYHCYRHMGFLVNSVTAGVVCLLGFAGNTMSFLVLARDKETPIASFLLQSLAFADNLFLSMWFLHFSINDLFAHLTNVRRFHVTWWYIRVYTYPMIFVAQTGTIYMTVLIAVTRFMAVCKPYKAVKWGTVQNIKLGVYSVFIFAVLYNLPRFFESRIITQDVSGNFTYKIVRTVMGKNRFYQLVYFDIMYYIISFALPLLLLAVLNTKLTIAYRAVICKRRGSLNANNRETNDHNITLVMIIVVLVFMLCNAPARVVQIIWSYNPVKCLSYGYWIMTISNVLEVFNSSINFLIYCLFRRQFRRVLNVQCCGRGPQNNPTKENDQQLMPLKCSPRTLETTYVNGHIEDSTEL